MKFIIFKKYIFVEAVKSILLNLLQHKIEKS